jgi:hybrid cluster-associated redox disulfide protein
MSTGLIARVTAETILDDLMRSHTATIPVFIRRRMMCVGCPVVRLHDVREACREHGIELDELLAELNGVVGGRAARG